MYPVMNTKKIDRIYEKQFHIIWIASMSGLEIGTLTFLQWFKKIIFPILIPTAKIFIWTVTCILYIEWIKTFCNGTFAELFSSLM